MNSILERDAHNCTNWRISLLTFMEENLCMFLLFYCLFISAPYHLRASKKICIDGALYSTNQPSPMPFCKKYLHYLIFEVYLNRNNKHLHVHRLDTR